MFLNAALFLKFIESLNNVEKKISKSSQNSVFKSSRKRFKNIFSKNVLEIARPFSKNYSSDFLDFLIFFMTWIKLWTPNRFLKTTKLFIFFQILLYFYIDIFFLNSYIGSSYPNAGICLIL